MHKYITYNIIMYICVPGENALHEIWLKKTIYILLCYSHNSSAVFTIRAQFNIYSRQCTAAVNYYTYIILSICMHNYTVNSTPIHNTKFVKI